MTVPLLCGLVAALLVALPGAGAAQVPYEINHRGLVDVPHTLRTIQFNLAGGGPTAGDCHSIAVWAVVDLDELGYVNPQALSELYFETTSGRLDVYRHGTGVNVFGRSYGPARLARQGEFAAPNAYAPDSVDFGQGRVGIKLSHLLGAPRCPGAPPGGTFGPYTGQVMIHPSWLPEPPPDTPTISCTVTASGPGGSQLRFEATATGAEGDPLAVAWTFSDGSTANAPIVQRTATTLGTFTGTVTASEGGVTVSDTCASVVTAPRLGGSIRLVHDDPADTTGRFALDDELDVVVQVSASNGLGALTAVAIDVDDLFDSNVGGLEIVEEPDVPATFTLGPNSSRTFTWRVRAVAAGPFRIDTTVTARDAAGDAVDPIELEANGSVTGLEVDVEIAYPVDPADPDKRRGLGLDNNGDGVVDAADHRIEVSFTVENLTDEPVGQLSTLDPDDPVGLSNLLLGDGRPSLTPIGDHDGDLGEVVLAPGAASGPHTYAFEATGAVLADAEVVVTGVPAGGDRPMRGFGTARVRFDSARLLEVELDLEERPYRAGQVVRLGGTLRNVAEPELDDDGTVVDEGATLGVLVFPLTEGNAGNGHLFAAADAGGRTPTAERAFVLGPGEEVAVGAIVATRQLEEDSQGSVRYRVEAWRLDGERGPDGAAPKVDQTQIEIVEEGELSAEHAFTLTGVPFETDTPGECAEADLPDAIVTCNLYVGLRELATGLYQVAQLVPQGIGEAYNAEQRLNAWGLYTLGQTFRALRGDAAAQQRLANEIEVQLATFVEVGAMGEQALVGIGQAINDLITEADRVFSTGDTDAMLAYTARFLGENPDLGVAGLARLRAFRAAATTTLEPAVRNAAADIARESAERAAREAQEGVLARVDDAIARGEDPAVSGVFRGNEDVTDLPRVYRGVYGARRTDIDNVLAIAAAENVNIAFRSRSPIVALLVDLGEIFVKPQDIKAKTVNVIDVYYLGYRRSSMGKVELTAPPVDYRLTAPGNETALQAALDVEMDRLASIHPEIAADPVWRAEVRGRLELRTREFPKQLQEFRRQRDEGIKLEFGYNEQGLPNTLDPEIVERRAARVEVVTDVDIAGVERRYYTLEMAGADGVTFKSIGGDIDIVGFLNPDGSPVLDPAKRVRVYAQMRELLDMQHGETLSFTNAEVGARLLREHAEGVPGSEALLVAGWDQRLRTGYLRENLSSPPPADGVPPNILRFELVSGAPAELVSDVTRGQAAQIPTYLDQLDAAIGRPWFYLPGRLPFLVDDLDEDQVATGFDRDADPLRPDGAGGIETYQAPGGVTPRSLPATASQPAAETEAFSVRRAAADDGDLDAAVAEMVAAGLGAPGRQLDGAAGGRWTPIEVADALAAGGGRVRMAPITATTAPVRAGATILEVRDPAALAMDADSPFFAAGDRIVIDPGGDREELAIVDRLGSLVLRRPLAHDHPAGTTVLLRRPGPGTGGPGTGGPGTGGPGTGGPGTGGPGTGGPGTGGPGAGGPGTGGPGTGGPGAGGPGTGGPGTGGPGDGDGTSLPTCPAPAVPRFSDVAAGSVHADAITCADGLGLVRGFGDGTFGPSRRLSRGQFATIVVQLLEAAGIELAGTHGFGDVAGSVHADAIGRLAAAGIVRGTSTSTFAPSRPVSRGQVVTVLDAISSRWFRPYPAAAAHGFVDTAGSVHAGAIDRLTPSRIVAGLSGGRFAPAAPVSRGQAAAFLVRWLTDQAEPR